MLTQGPATKEKVSDRDWDYVMSTVVPITDEGDRVLNTKTLPGWLIEATAGRYVMSAEAGYPQICRFWDYIDWLELINRHQPRITADDQWWPTTAALEIVEDARAQGYDACADIALWFDGWTLLRKPKFNVEIWGLLICESLPMSEAERYTDMLRDTGNQQNLDGHMDYEQGCAAAFNLTRTSTALSALVEHHRHHYLSDEHHWIFW